MKGRKKVLLGIMVLCLVLAGLLTPERAYASNSGNVGTKATIEEDSRSSINKKRELIAKYTGYKEHNLSYYGEMIVNGKRCSGFEFTDDDGYSADFLVLIFENGKIIGYYSTGDYRDVKAKDKNTEKEKTKYTMKEDKVEYKDDSGIVRGIITFQYPQFKGTSASIKKVNSALKKESNKFFKSEIAKRLKEYTERDIDDKRFHKDDEQYFWKASSKVSYNKNGIVSFRMEENWLAGGVGNRWFYGLNYNLKTGKRLTIKDVILGNAKDKILKAAKEYCGSDTNAYNIVKNTKDYKFYFSKGKVYICFGSYELERGTGWDIFSVTGKYK